MGKRRSAFKKKFRRRVLDAEELQTNTIVLTKAEVARDGYKTSKADGICENNTNRLPSQGPRACVPVYFILLLTVFLLSVWLFFCRGRRPKPTGPKGASLRRSNGTTTKSARRMPSIRGAPMAKNKDLSSLENKDSKRQKDELHRLCQDHVGIRHWEGGTSKQVVDP
ncbi:hypothetical protein Bbelb_216330 [Branchiostoma belcheri]|nr:hypothetical protein Bbelb_216330 [Branchiostoma belcheri]